jgi:Na+/H+-dicarboxylate symporter
MIYSEYDPSNPKLLESIVCFADILGFSNLIMKSDEEETSSRLLKDLHETLKNLYSEIIELNPYGSFKTFTDNIILAYPKIEDGEG